MSNVRKLNSHGYSPIKLKSNATFVTKKYQGQRYTHLGEKLADYLSQLQIQTSMFAIIVTQSLKHGRADVLRADNGVRKL